MESIMDFIKARLKERTSLDGAALIAICGSIILFGGIVKIAAWIGLGYGIYTLVKKED
jgi:ABC-type phosphate transport system permease subunit